MLIEKWYMDFQDADAIGYYYVGRLVMGGVSLSFSEIHHHADSRVLEDARISLKHTRDCRAVSSRNYRLDLAPGVTTLALEHGGGRLTGRWAHRTSALKTPDQPVFQDGSGQCIWKIWAPQAEVHLQNEGHNPFTVRGAGYIDYVRLSIPLWRLPFRRLCWGRLFAGDEWFCLFFLQAPGFRRGLLADRSGWRRDVRVSMIPGEGREDRRFDWEVGSETISFEVTRELHAGPILDLSRTRWLPSAARRYLDRGGMERKFRVRGIVNGRSYSGIMEEVKWPDMSDGVS